MSRQYPHAVPEQEEPDAPPPIQSGGGGRDDFGERLAKIETQMEYVATKEDIQTIRTEIEKIRVWVLKGVIGGIVIATGVATAIVKLL